MKLNKYEQSYKEFLKKDREYDALWREMCSCPSVPITPYQRGWNIVFDLDEKMQKYHKYEVMKPILDLFYHPVFINDAKLVRIVRDIKSYTELQKNPTFAKTLRYRDFSRHMKPEEYNKHQFPMYSVYEVHKPETDNPRYKGTKEYKFTYSGWIVCRIKPNMITHKKDIDGDLQSRYDKLRDELYQMWKKYGRNYTKSFPAGKYRSLNRDMIAKYKKNEIEDDQLHVDVFYDYEY